MKTTREAILTALVAVAVRAAAQVPQSRAVRSPVKPEDAEQGEVVFTILEAGEGELTETVGNRPPFYVEDRIAIEVVAVDAEAALIGRHTAALRALDAELDADHSLGGIAKGMRWFAQGAEIIPVEGASAERADEVTVIVEYEVASRLAV